MRQTLVLKSWAALFRVPSDRIPVFFTALALAHLVAWPTDTPHEPPRHRVQPADRKVCLTLCGPQFRPGTCQNGLQGLGFHAQLRGALAAIRGLSKSRSRAGRVPIVWSCRDA